jgi:hypothetical protein
MTAQLPLRNPSPAPAILNHEGTKDTKMGLIDGTCQRLWYSQVRHLGSIIWRLPPDSWSSELADTEAIALSA